MPALPPRSAPARSGVPARAVAALLDGLEQPETEGHSIMVIRPSWWAPFSTGRPHPLYPLTKSFRPDVS